MYWVHLLAGLHQRVDAWEWENQRRVAMPAHKASSSTYLLHSLHSHTIPSLPREVLQNFKLLPNLAISGWCSDYWRVADAAAGAAAAAATAAAAAVSVLSYSFLQIPSGNHLASSWLAIPAAMSWTDLAVSAGMALGNQMNYTARVAVQDFDSIPPVGRRKRRAAIYRGTNVLIVALWKVTSNRVVIRKADIVWWS